jgi:hypothetical protein
MVERAHRGTDERAKLRAVVQLGGLTPADVIVTARSADLERETAEEVRLWSVQSHHNGAFVFEAAANARAMDEATDLLVTVEPARPLPGDRVLTRAMRLVAPSWPDDCTTCAHALCAAMTTRPLREAPSACALPKTPATSARGSAGDRT